LRALRLVPAPERCPANCAISVSATISSRNSGRLSSREPPLSLCWCVKPLRTRCWRDSRNSRVSSQDFAHQGQGRGAAGSSGAILIALIMAGWRRFDIYPWNIIPVQLTPKFVGLQPLSKTTSCQRIDILFRSG